MILHKLIQVCAHIKDSDRTTSYATSSPLRMRSASCNDLSISKKWFFLFLFFRFLLFPCFFRFCLDHFFVQSLEGSPEKKWWPKKSLTFGTPSACSKPPPICIFVQAVASNMRKLSWQPTLRLLQGPISQVSEHINVGLNFGLKWIQYILTLANFIRRLLMLQIHLTPEIIM